MNDREAAAQEQEHQPAPTPTSHSTHSLANKSMTHSHLLDIAILLHTLVAWINALSSRWCSYIGGKKRESKLVSQYSTMPINELALSRAATGD